MKWLVAILLLASVAQAATTADRAVTYDWAIDIEDPQGDHTGPNPVGGVSNNNFMNPENDILAWAFTEDDHSVIARFTMAQCDFEYPVGLAFVIIELTVGGKDLEMSASYEDGCTNVEVAEVDSVLGDDDSPVAGMRVEARPADDEIYLFADHATSGFAEGDSIRFDAIHTGRQFAGRYTFNIDVVASDPFVIGSTFVPEPVPMAPETVYRVAPVDGVDEAQSFDEPYTGTFVINWTTEYAEASYEGDVALTAGTVGVSMKDGIGVDLFAENYDASAAPDGTLSGSNGTWQVILEFDAFVGTLDWLVTPIVPVLCADGSEPSETGCADGSTPATPDNAPAEKPDATPVPTTNGTGGGKESPGVALPVLAATLGLVLVARRRYLE